MSKHKKFKKHLKHKKFNKSGGHDSRRNNRNEPAISSKISGKISIVSSGFGFVCPDDGGRDIFIPPRFLESAMDGDRVEVGIFDEEKDAIDDKGPAGRIIEILERGRERIVGELISGRKARPLNKKLPEDIKLVGSLQGAQKGDWVYVRLLNTGKNHDEARKGEVILRIGKAGEIDKDLDAVAAEYELPAPYTPEEELEAENLEPRDIERKDLTELFCVTIDPHDAKDFDDAISVSKGENDSEIILGVHIADVAAWIKPGGKWDKEAMKRAFTAYLPGRTLPMLPKTLTKKISLTAGSVSKAHSIMMRVNSATGEILSSSRFHSDIDVKKRLTFDEVQNYLDGSKADDWDKNFTENFDILVALFRKMHSHRKQREKFLELATTEIRILCDEENKEITGIEKRVQKEADQLVEDCMLAANTESAKELIAKSIPAPYRVHQTPDPEKVLEFSIFIEKTFGFFPGDLTNRVLCNEFLRNLPDDHKKPVIIGAFLRSLPRACYQEEWQEHYGLGKEKYTHFTSPIRRYPDLLVHQQLWNQEIGKRLRSKNKIAEIAAECSKKEEKNDEAYYAANDRLKLRYLGMSAESDRSKLYEAVITKISSAGLLAEIIELGLYGFVPRELLSSSMKYGKRSKKLKSMRDSRDYKCGDFIFLRLDHIDLARGSAVFRPVN